MDKFEMIIGPALLTVLLCVIGYCVWNENPRRLRHDPWNGVSTYSLRHADGRVEIYTVNSDGKIQKVEENPTEALD